MAKYEKVKVDKRSKAYRDAHPENQRKRGMKMGAKLKIIDWDQVDKMLIAGCNGVQVAAVIGIHEETLYDRCVKEKNVAFSCYAQEKRQKGNSFLHSKQFSLAMKGDRSMLIWLGKQRLDQRDNRDMKVDGLSQISIVNYSDQEIKTWQEEQIEHDSDKDSDS